jgi:hypothetical protein
VDILYWAIAERQRERVPWPLGAAPDRSFGNSGGLFHTEASYGGRQEIAGKRALNPAVQCPTNHGLPKLSHSSVTI